MAERCIITTAFGNRTHNVAHLIKNIRQYVDYPIVVITSKDSIISLPVDINHNPDSNLNVEIKLVERLWPNHHRSGQRNGDYYQMKATLDSEYDQILYLDDDMRICDRGFIQGFELAKKFGVCLPLNPRSFVGVDAAIGADVPIGSRAVEIPLATAYNCGTMFVDKEHCDTDSFLKGCAYIILKKPMRGPLACWNTVNETKIVPYLLPPQWCVCQENIGIHNPIILHTGHEAVREYYKVD